MKTLLIAFAAGALLTSCSSSSALDKEAAAELCEHLKVGEETTNVIELVEATQEKSKKFKEWQAKYNGKLTDGFEEELKTACPEGHKSATEMGLFEKVEE